jgi:wobble nucleotide-excising tRNase
MARPTIKSINSIKSLGIFHSFKKTDQIDFKEKTIVYGWNGTGKSTLARLFRALETKQPLEEFPKAEFEIELSDGSKIKHNTLSASNLNMRVFNKQFVDANINWDETVEKILLLSEENIEARKKMEHHKNNLQKLEENLKNEKNKAEVAEKEISKFCTTAAKNIKNSLIVIATDDTYFMNYDKTKFSRLLENQADLLKLGTCQMSEEELKNKLVSAQPNKKAEITTDDLSLEKSLYEEHYNKVVEIISRSVTASVIEEFRDNSELSTWVQTGLEIHRQNNSTVCEFCGSTIPANRLEELEKHFSDNYRKLIDDIDTETAILKTLEPKDYQLEKNDLYEELKEDYHVLCKQLNQQMDAFKEIIINWQDKLIEKKLAPFDKIEIISEGFLSAIETINS